MSGGPNATNTVDRQVAYVVAPDQTTVSCLTVRGAEQIAEMFSAVLARLDAIEAQLEAM